MVLRSPNRLGAELFISFQSKRSKAPQKRLTNQPLIEVYESPCFLRAVVRRVVTNIFDTKMVAHMRALLLTLALGASNAFIQRSLPARQAAGRSRSEGALSSRLPTSPAEGIALKKDFPKPNVEDTDPYR